MGLNSRHSSVLEEEEEGAPFALMICIPLLLSFLAAAKVSRGRRGAKASNHILEEVPARAARRRRLFKKIGGGRRQDKGDERVFGLTFLEGDSSNVFLT